jgi:hypothetical protein
VRWSGSPPPACCSGGFPASAAAQHYQTTQVEIPSGNLLLRGQVFAAEAAGQRPTVLLIPGWPGNPNDVLGLGALLPAS